MVIVEVGHFDLLCVMQVGEREIYEISREDQKKVNLPKIYNICSFHHYLSFCMGKL